MTNVEQFIRKIFMFNNYFIIFMLCKDNDVFLVYLVFNFEILNAKTIENDIVLFWFKEKIEIDDHLIYLTSYTCLIDYDVSRIFRANITTQDRFALWLATFNKNDNIRMLCKSLKSIFVSISTIDVFKKKHILQNDVDI